MTAGSHKTGPALESYVATTLRVAGSRLPTTEPDGGVQVAAVRLRRAMPVRPQRAALRVQLYGGACAFQCPGGGETQLLKTAEYLRRAGVRAKLFNPWRDRLRQADVLHLFGTLPEHLALVKAAKHAGIPTVLSTIAWYDARACSHLADGAWQALWHTARFSLRAVWPGCPSWRRTLYQSVDLLLPNSRGEARQLRRYFQVVPSKIHVVPNAAELRFEDGDPDLFPAIYGVRDFVLCPGRIEPRKNPLAVLRALRGLHVPVVVLGDVVPGFEAYARACEEAAGDHVHFVRAVDRNSPLLASAYRAARCVVLASWFETPGLAALEAALAETPLVLTRYGATREYFGRYARYVRPDRPEEIRAAVVAALASQGTERGRAPRKASGLLSPHPSPPPQEEEGARARRRPAEGEEVGSGQPLSLRRLARRVRRRFNWYRVAQACQEAYAKVVG